MTVVNPISSAVTSTLIIIAFLTVFIFAVVDGALPLHWKLIVCFMTALMTAGSIKAWSDEYKESKKSIHNPEDLR